MLKGFHCIRNMLLEKQAFLIEQGNGSVGSSISCLCLTRTYSLAAKETIEESARLRKRPNETIDVMNGAFTALQAEDQRHPYDISNTKKALAYGNWEAISFDLPAPHVAQADAGRCATLHASLAQLTPL